MGLQVDHMFAAATTLLQCIAYLVMSLHALNWFRQSLRRKVVWATHITHWHPMFLKLPSLVQLTSYEAKLLSLAQLTSYGCCLCTADILCGLLPAQPMQVWLLERAQLYIYIYIYRFCSSSELMDAKNNWKCKVIGWDCITLAYYRALRLAVGPASSEVGIKEGLKTICYMLLEGFQNTMQIKVKHCWFAQACMLTEPTSLLPALCDQPSTPTRPASYLRFLGMIISPLPSSSWEFTEHGL